ncbi:cell division protein FtsW [bacterium]|nr:cell division protein FtsW [bacterium]
MTGRHPMDKILLMAVLVLLTIGCLMIYSASAFWSAERNQDNYSAILLRHLMRVSLGLLIMVAVSRIDYHCYRSWAPVLLAVLAVLLVAVLFTPRFRGSSRAFSLPMGRFHPAEYMKLAMVLFLSSVLARTPPTRDLMDRRLMVHYGILLGVTALVLVEPDLGTASVLFAAGMVLFFLAGTPGDRLAKMALVVSPFVCIGMAVNGYQRARILDFARSKAGLEPLPYQVKHSLIALANGGWFGLGYGEGRAKDLYLPEPFSDFILATLGEEFGFVGVCVLFGVVAVLLWRGTRIAVHAPDRFGFLAAAGITSLLLINALINAGVVLHLIPTTGLPFPFVSYGGSSLFVYMAGMGILLNISGQAVPSFHQFTTERGRIRWPEIR